MTNERICSGIDSLQRAIAAKKNIYFQLLSGDDKNAQQQAAQELQNLKVQLFQLVNHACKAGNRKLAVPAKISGSQVNNSG